MMGAIMAPVLSWLRFWRVAAIGALLLALGVQTYRITGLKRDQAKKVAAAEKARAEAATKVIAIERARARIAAKREQAYEKTIANLRIAAAGRLQAITGRVEPLPSIPDAAFQVDASTGGDRLCIETPFAVALMLAADENTQQLLDLQMWVREQEEIR